jgi:hypothetical protein
MRQFLSFAIFFIFFPISSSSNIKSVLEELNRFPVRYVEYSMLLFYKN